MCPLTRTAQASPAPPSTGVSIVASSTPSRDADGIERTEMSATGGVDLKRGSLSPGQDTNPPPAAPRRTSGCHDADSGPGRLSRPRLSAPWFWTCRFSRTRPLVKASSPHHPAASSPIRPASRSGWWFPPLHKLPIELMHLARRRVTDLLVQQPSTAMVGEHGLTGVAASHQGLHQQP